MSIENKLTMQSFVEDKVTRAFFGDALVPMQDAVQRSGKDALIFLLFAMGKDIHATANGLANAWAAEMPNVPVDHDMIHMLLCISEKLKRSWLFRTHAMYTLKKAGFYPVPKAEVAA
jgi:hypothetical protein